MGREEERRLDRECSELNEEEHDFTRSEKQLFKEFREVAYVPSPGHTYYIHSRAAIEFSERCEQLDLVISKLEGLEVDAEKGTIRPRLDLIGHVDPIEIENWSSEVCASVEVARIVVARGGVEDNLYYEFFALEKSEIT